MKKILSILMTVMLACTSCSNQYMDDLVTLHRKLYDVAELNALNKARMEAINSSLEVLTALAEVLSEGFYVESITPFDGTSTTLGGYLIKFSNGKTVTIHHGADGADKYLPKLSIGLDSDGKYYWLLGSEWVLDEDGHKVPVSSDKKVPIVEIRNGYWYISYNGGDSWQLLGRATGEDGYDGEYGSNPIVDIDASSEDFVKFTMANGTSFIVPIRQHLKLILDTDPEGYLISAWETIRIGYTLSREEEGTYVAVESDGFYTAVVKQNDNVSGEILISCPRAYEEGYVNVLLYSDGGISDLKVVNLKEKKMTLQDGSEYSVGVGGGVLVIPYTANFNFSLQVNDAAKSWLKPYLKDGKIFVEVPSNTGAARSGIIAVMSDNGTLPFASVVVTQASSTASIDKGSFVLEYGGGTVSSVIVTSYGVQVQIPDQDKEWISSSVNQGGSKYEYSVHFSVDANRYMHERGSDIKILSSDGTREIALIHISQLCRLTDISDALILKVRPNYSNDFTAVVPIDMYPYNYNNQKDLDCYIDWGDGSGSHIRCDNYDEWLAGDRYPKHQYKDVVPGQIFEVVVTGRVPHFGAGEVPNLYKTSITGIEQWGKLGMVSMENAFSGFTMIESLPLDDNDCFTNVRSFNSAFEACSGLRSISEQLFASAGLCTSFNNTFTRCSSLVSLPQNLFANTVNAEIFYNTFSECTALQSLPEKLFSGCLNAETFEGTFSGCQGLRSIPSGLFANCPDLTNVNYCFNDAGLETIPADLFAKCTMLTYANQLFQSCDNLTSVPASLFDNNRMLSHMHAMFGWCGTLKGESPYTVIGGKKVHLYERNLYQDHFVTPVEYSQCFYATDVSDRAAMPEIWREY